MKSTLFFILFISSIFSNGQSMVRIHESSSGGFFSNSDCTLSVSVGDCASFIYYENECISISTGYQQADEFKACTGDFNHDQTINVIDLLLLTSDFGQAGSCIDGDLDHNQQVSISDYLIFSSVFTNSCY